jgi:hypothetical protein
MIQIPGDDANPRPRPRHEVESLFALQLSNKFFGNSLEKSDCRVHAPPTIGVLLMPAMP